MELSRVITYFAVSAILVAMPDLMMTTSGTFGAVAPATSSGLSPSLDNTQIRIIDILSLMSYIIGIGFGIKGALALKEYNENPGSYTVNEETSKPAPPPPQKVNIQKAKSYESIVKTTDDTVYSKAIPKQKIYDYDFEDKELNELGVRIQSKVKYLKGHSFLQKDMESLLMVENTEKEYLRVVHESYIDIPSDKRGNRSTEGSPYDLASKQLNLLVEALDQIEDKIVNHNIMNQKANEIFLKEKIANM